jgi:hypothetical protein
MVLWSEFGVAPVADGVCGWRVMRASKIQEHGSKQDTKVAVKNLMRFFTKKTNLRPVRQAWKPAIQENKGDEEGL